MLRKTLLTVMLLLVGCSGLNAPTPTLTPTLVPTSTATPPPTLTPLAPTEALTPTPEETPEPTVVIEFDQLLNEGTPPPFDIALPAGWDAQYFIFTLPDVDATLRPMQLTVYQGPVSGGTGSILVLWGFPNFIDGNPFTAPGATPLPPNLWSDGLRLFRTALVDQGCNAGTDLQRSYTVGEREGTGTQFAIVDCPESPDTRGWFVGLQEQGLNLVFFAYAEPIEAMDSASGELQSILDSVRFRVTEEYLSE